MDRNEERAGSRQLDTSGGSTAMIRTRIVGLCLAVASLGGAITATAAQAAEPEYYKGGAPLAEVVKYSITSGETRFVASSMTIKCSRGKGSGELFNATEGKSTVTYTGCENTVTKTICQNVPKTPGSLLVEWTSKLTTATEFNHFHVPPEKTKIGNNDVIKVVSIECGGTPVSIGGDTYSTVGQMNIPVVHLTKFFNEKAEESEPGCGKQQFQYNHGMGTCWTLNMGGEPAWFLTAEQIKFSGKQAVETRSEEETGYKPVFFTKGAIGATAPIVPFTATLGAAFLEGKGGSKITCKGGTAIGEVTAPSTTQGNETTFTGCETGGVPCENAGAGTIKTELLEGALGNVVKEKTPGIRLFSEADGLGGTLASFTCAGGAIGVEVVGSVIGSLSGASGKSVAEGKLATSNKLTFAETKGIQKYTKFIPGEGEAGEEQLETKVSGGPFEKAGQSVVITLKTTPAGNLGITQ
jgi:hypothetical protein